MISLTKSTCTSYIRVLLLWHKRHWQYVWAYTTV